MSLSITINNIDDLTDTERAVLRMIVSDKQVTLTGPTATRSFIESLAGGEDKDIATTSTFHSAHPELPDGPVVPAAPAAPAAPTPASAELDSAGLPWDKRIHSSSRAKVADGTWRKMRGVDDALVATVEAELRAVQAIPVPTPANSVVNPVTGETLTEGELLMTATLAEMQAKLAAAEELPQHPVPVPPVQPAPTPAAPLTFADLMKHVTPLLVGNKLSQDKLLAICAEFSLPHLAALGARPDLVEAVKARIDAEVGV